MNISLFDLLTYFIIYSFLGWIMESIIRSIFEKKLINTGFLYGPFCPIYGFGAIIMIVFLKYFEQTWILLFAMSFLFLSFWEYIVGVILEKIFKTRYWDYSDQKFNFQGRVCLVNSLFWGFLGVVFIKYIHPFIVNMIQYIDKTSLLIMIYTSTIIFIIDTIISVMKLINIKATLQKVEELNEQIREKIAEIKNMDKAKTQENLQAMVDKTKLKTQENLQAMVDKTKLKRDRILRKLYRHVYRLKKAFPAINTKEITEVLNKKMEIKKKGD